MIYKCIGLTSGYPDKAYLWTVEGDFKNRYYNHISSFKTKTKMYKTTLARYVWGLKQRQNITTALKWYIVKYVPSYSNITKSYVLCLHEKFEILTYPNQDELWNKRSNELFLNVVMLISIYCLTIKLMIGIPFNPFRIIA